ncbi:thioredoxin [Glaciihabitans arcticus]|uniref:Thioredoxin n=1 Tax=Glaciihabitans arcticus TaxID=2668039 RepID=A0A4Q9GP25_9MICO|nr:thioredoxin family protein [Glaciihabitans arcticus]TBN56455.1 thioredoxin [Glaciihabitans arcticus]
MTALAIAGVLAALIATATVLGLLWKRQDGRATRGSGRVGRGEITLGSTATLLQFSSEICAYCPATRRVLSQAATDDIAFVELDVVDNQKLVTRFNILQTPTTLILDHNGAVQARIGGAVRPETLNAELDRILAAA